MKKILILSFLLILPLVLTNCKFPHPKNSEVITKDTTWSGEVYIDEIVHVPENTTLTIEPGTVIKFKHWRHGYTEESERLNIIVEGTLNVNGTADKPVRFTSDATDPEHGDWDEITIEDGGVAVIKFTIVEYGWTGVVANTCESLLLENSIIRWNTGAGVFMGNQSQNVTLDYNQIYQNGHSNIEVEGGSDPTITNNTLYEGGNIAIFIGDEAYATIHNNVIRDNSEGGITLEFNSHADIINNFFQT